MRQKRAKAYKKQVNVYLHTFKFREPFQTIIDPELVETCHKASFDIAKGLTRTIQAETKPMITQCCMEALYKKKDQNVIDVAKKFERRRCNHREPIDPNACIESITVVNGENKHRYVVASQNADLRKTLRKVPGIPLVHMNRSVMVMEPLSEASAKYSQQVENKKLTGGLNDIKIGIANKEEEQVEEQKKKRKGPKGPNPLSVKKKKENPQQEKEKQATSKSKRKRSHKKKKDDTDGDSNEQENVTEKSNTSEEKSENKEENVADENPTV